MVSQRNSDDIDDYSLDDHGHPTHSLFSMRAADNAEVVPPEPPRGTDGLWSVSANPDGEDSQYSPADDQTASVHSDAARGWPVTSYDERQERDARNDPHQTEEPARSTPFARGDEIWLASDETNLHEDEPQSNSGEVNFEFANRFHMSDEANAQDAASDGGYADPTQEGHSDSAQGGYAGEGASEGYGDSAQDGHEAGPAPVFDTVGSVFTSEPVEHNDDVVDEAEIYDDPWDAQQPVEGGPSLFSSGPEPGIRLPGGTQATDSDRSGRRRESRDARDRSGLWTVTDEPIGQDSIYTDPLRGDSLWEPAGPERTRSPRRGSARPAPPPAVEDLDDDGAPGFETAILRLHPHDRERATVALAVVGALLEEGEPVLGVVTGQMLGRPAAVAVTTGRVLVANDRRWQPVVDLYVIDSDLRVRGRHDRDMAALIFSDIHNLSMVDGITEVAIAMELAEHIRVIAGGEPK